jgi:glycosyltransferase involved in cell wall biosynthesis
MVSPFFPPVINGVSMHVYHLVKGLVAQGNYIQLHTIKPNISSNTLNLNLNFNNLRTLCFEKLVHKGSWNQQPLSLSYIMETLRMCDDFDVVHVHDFPKICNEALVLLLKKLKARKPIVLTPHAAGMPSPSYKGASPKGKLYWFFGVPQKVFRSVDRIVAVSSLEQELFGKMCGIQKVSLIPEGVPANYFVNAPFFVDDGRLKIVFVGRIVERKGIKELLYAIKEIVGRGYSPDKIELVCIGADWGYLNTVVKIVNDLGLNRVVKMLGSLSESEKIEYLSWCDLLVLPSYYESFGIPVIEAMARAKPVVATETVGSRSLVRHGETGFLVKVGDPCGLAEALMRFLRYPELKYRMGSEALKQAWRFHMENMIKGHINLYESIMAN